jgi:hypothetical protein
MPKKQGRPAKPKVKKYLHSLNSELEGWIEDCAADLNLSKSQVVEQALIHFLKLHFNGGFKYPKDKK